MYGKRFIYDKKNGQIINMHLSSEGNIKSEYRPLEIDFIDLPFNYENEKLKNVELYHIDISKDKNKTNIDKMIIIDKYREQQESEQEKLLREKQELENQLLIEKDKNIGGIL